MALLSGTGSVDFRCTLNGDPAANAASDDSASAEMGSYRGLATLSTELTVTLTANATIALRCRGSNVQSFGDDNSPNLNVVARETKIVATPLSSTTRVAGTAGTTGS
jgi:hypothetical protein